MTPRTEKKPHENAAGVKNKNRPAVKSVLGKTVGHIKRVFADMGVRGRKKAAFFAAFALLAVCLVCFYAVCVGPRLRQIIILNGEITARQRILDVKKANYAAMPDNVAALEALSASLGGSNNASSEIPGAVLNIADMMRAHGVSEYNLNLSPGYEYGVGFRQPVNVSGKTVLESAYAFIEALENNPYHYEITELIIRDDADSGVFLNIGLDIIVAN